MATKIVEIKKPKLKNPIFIEGLPGVGNVGRIAANYLIEELKAEKFAELYSSHFMPFVLPRKDGDVHVLNNEFYYWKSKKKGQRDMIILVGDSQSVDSEGHYEITEEVLKYIEKLGVKEMITLAGLGIGENKDNPEVIGVANDPSIVKKYKKHGIRFDRDDMVGTIVGASGLLIGLGKHYGMKGACIMGETSGAPLIPDPKAAESVLTVLTKMLKVEVDTENISNKVKEMESLIKRMENLKRKTVMQMLKQQMTKGGKKGDDSEEDLSYIG